MDKDEFHSEVISKMFQHEVDSTEVLSMYGKLNNIKGLNKESIMFKYETKKKTGEVKETDENEKSADNKSNKKYSTLKKIKLGFNSQFNNILKVAEATKTMIMNKIKVATCDICNETDER